jgi:hypothetical protein
VCSRVPGNKNASSVQRKRELPYLAGEVLDAGGSFSLSGRCIVRQPSSPCRRPPTYMYTASKSRSGVTISVPPVPQLCLKPASCHTKIKVNDRIIVTRQATCRPCIAPVMVRSLQLVLECRSCNSPPRIICGLFLHTLLSNSFNHSP